MGFSKNFHKTSFKFLWGGLKNFRQNKIQGTNAVTGRFLPPVFCASVPDDYPSYKHKFHLRIIYIG